MPASADLSGRDFDAAVRGDAPGGLRAANLLSIEDLSQDEIVLVWASKLKIYRRIDLAE